MFQDPEYLKWANEETIHVLSYSIDLEAPNPEPLAEVERDGEEVLVIAMYPMLTENEAAFLVNDLNAKVKFPVTTPWSGVIAPDGTTILAEMKKGTKKEFRALYEEQQKKYGTPMPRAAWLETNRLLSASGEAEATGEWRNAVAAALAAKKAAGECPKPLAERIAAQTDALDQAGTGQVESAQKQKDPAKRTKELGRIAADFAGLPAGDAAQKALAPK